MKKFIMVIPAALKPVKSKLHDWCGVVWGSSQ